MEPANNVTQQILVIKEKAKERIQNTFYGIQDKNSVSSLILVVDKEGLEIFSNYVKMGDLIDFGISGIEKLELNRKPFPKQHAVYFLTPQKESVEKLLQDFSKDEPQYAYAHLLFTSSVNDHLVNLISGNAGLKGRLKTFKEINLDFIVSGKENLIDLRMENSLSVFFSQLGSITHQRYIDRAASKLLSILTTIGKVNEIEIAYAQTDSQNPKTLATALSGKVKDLISSLESRNSETLDKDAGKITFLILDRSVDSVLPSLHTYIYRPMLYDLLKVHNDIITIGAAHKVHNLNNDNVFQKYKHKHFAEVLDQLPNDIKSFSQSQSAAGMKKMQAGEKVNLDNMDNIMKSMPEYNKMAEDLTTQQKLSEKLFNEFNNTSLKEIFDLEQTIVTGIDSEGKALNTNKILSKILPTLSNESISDSDKVRILIATMLYFELSEKDRNQLLTAIGDSGVDSLKNLKWLGADFVASKTKHKIDDSSKKEAKKGYQNEGLDYGRYSSVLISLIEGTRTRLMNRSDLKGFFSGKVSLEGVSIKALAASGNDKTYKSLRNKVGGGIGKTALAGKSAEEQAVMVNKFIIFMIGGLSYSEVSLIANLGFNANEAVVIQVGTEIINPSQYIQNLSKMESY